MPTPRVSIALVGESYYLCGPRGNNVRGAVSADFRDLFRPNQSYIHHTFVALGENGSYYVRYFNERNGERGRVYQLANYPDLDTYLDSNNSIPVCVALGENGCYFYRDENGATAWRLPQSIEDCIKPGDQDNPVEHLVLGKDNAFYAKLRDGRRRYNFRGHYGSLEAEVSHLSTSDVLCLGMNLQDDRSYVVITRDGVRFNAGRAQLSGRGLTSEIFDTWFERFRSG